MRELIRFRIRPGYKSETLLVEFCGDHRADDYPEVAEILERALGSERGSHPVFDEVKIGLSTDQFFSYWIYENGAYEIDDDTWGLFIAAPENNRQIMSDIEKALLENGRFVKESVDFSNYV
jgi:hypothetical protein